MGLGEPSQRSGWHGWRGGVRRRARLVAVAVAVLAVVTACGGGNDSKPVAKTTTSAPPPSQATGECGDLRIAYDPSKGYEASAFIVGTLAENELKCDVQYVKTTSRRAWRLVARGDADVYLDAYGNADLARQLAGNDGPVTILGPNGITGGVDLLAPLFMGELGLHSYRDLTDTEGIGWGEVTPAITTVPELLPLAHAFVDFQNLDNYVVRDYSKVGLGGGMRNLLQQARKDNDAQQPNLYLVEGPIGFLGDGPGRATVEIPSSAARACTRNAVSTLCSLSNFNYRKIVNTDFAASNSPAYNLIYRYQLGSEEAANILEIVELSGYNVLGPDVASWINTHRNVWKRWLD
jgi:glycine betaine/proline transport system substrate-binding protein